MLRGSAAIEFEFTRFHGPHCATFRNFGPSARLVFYICACNRFVKRQNSCARRRVTLLREPVLHFPASWTKSIVWTKKKKN